MRMYECFLIIAKIDQLIITSDVCDKKNKTILDNILSTYRTTIMMTKKPFIYTINMKT